MDFLRWERKEQLAFRSVHCEFVCTIYRCDHGCHTAWCCLANVLIIRIACPHAEEGGESLFLFQFLGVVIVQGTQLRQYRQALKRVHRHVRLSSILQGGNTLTNNRFSLYLTSKCSISLMPPSEPNAAATAAAVSSERDFHLRMKTACYTAGHTASIPSRVCEVSQLLEGSFNNVEAESLPLQDGEHHLHSFGTQECFIERFHAVKMRTCEKKEMRMMGNLLTSSWHLQSSQHRRCTFSTEGCCAMISAKSNTPVLSVSSWSSSGRGSMSCCLRVSSFFNFYGRTKCSRC